MERLGTRPKHDQTPTGETLNPAALCPPLSHAAVGCTFWKTWQPSPCGFGCRSPHGFSLKLLFHGPGILNFLGIPLYLKLYPHSFVSSHQDLGGSFHDLMALSLLTSAKPWPNTASGSSSNQTLCFVALASKGLGVWSEKQSHKQPYMDLLLEGKSFGVHTFRPLDVQ